MKHRFLSALLAAALALTASFPVVSASASKSAAPALQMVSASETPLAQASYDSESVYNAMIALQDKYPDGMEWTNDDYYSWNGGIYSYGGGCVAFAFILSDAAFGNLPARRYTAFDPDSVRVGDILRNYGHSYIVLEVHEDYFTIAEGNINESILWGREIGFDGVADGFEEHLTRYPEDEETTEPTTEEPSDARFYVRLEISSEPDKTNYLVGEELDLTGLTINTWYTELGTWFAWEEDASVADYPNTEDEYIEVTGYDPYTLGSQEISVTLKKYNNAMDMWVSSTDTFTITVKEDSDPVTTYPTWGNVNGDEKIDASDAAEVLVAAAAIGAGGDSGLTFTQEIYADVDGNEILDASDAAWILSYAAYVGTGGEGTLQEYIEMNSLWS